MDNFLDFVDRHILSARYFSAGILGLTSVWSVAEAMVYAHGAGRWAAALFLLVVAITAWNHARATRGVVLRVSSLEKPVRITFGDIFGHQPDGSLVVCSDNWFFTRHTKLINPRSLQGQAVEKIFIGEPWLYARSIAESLGQQEPVSPEDDAAPIGLSAPQPVGTTAVVHGKNQAKTTLFVTVLCTVESEPTSKQAHGKASAPDVWTMYMGLWDAIRKHQLGRTVFVPLMGVGQSGSGLSGPQVLQLALGSLVASARAAPISDAICFVIREDDAESFDLPAVRRIWSIEK